MKLAFALYKYFPYGGLQRDMMRIADACIMRGHEVHVYCIIWDAPLPSHISVSVAPVKAWSNHQRNKKFEHWLKDQLSQHHADAVVGFNKLSGLDFYYAADPCYQEKALSLRSQVYRLGSRYKHFYQQEKSVFERCAKTEILMISEVQKPFFIRHYNTQDTRFHLLPPGISRDRVAPDNAKEIRSAFRKEWQLADDENLILMIGSGFKTKGLDRALSALNSLPNDLKQKTRFLVVGQDNPTFFNKKIRLMSLERHVNILNGRDDIPRFLLGADLLIHPAYNENTGTVLLEALVAGLPVLVTDVCGYAHYISDADAGCVLPSPFEQKQLNIKLAEMLTSNSKTKWQENGLRFSKTADIYSMPERAADIICSTSNRKKSHS